MKVGKITLMMLSAVMFLSCNKETQSTDVADSNYISFGKLSTRATLDHIQANGFSVWGIFYNAAHQDGYWQFNNVSVTQDTDGQWTYDEPRLWIDNSIYGFVATYPGNSGFDVVEEEVDGAVRRYIALTDYQTTSTADTDILIASSFVDTSVENYETTVPLTFKHLFSKINIKVKQNQGTNERDNFIIDKITLKGIKGKGTCKVLYSSFEPEWEYDNTTISFSKDIPGDKIIGLTGEVMLSDNGLLLLPQIVEAGSIEVEISFRIGLEGNEDISTYESKTYNAYLPSTVNWEYGKSITYTALLSTYNPIIFDAPTVETWGGAQSGGTVIIK